MVKKWRALCEADKGKNGLPSTTGPGPGGNWNGRSSVSPCFSSLPSSCNTSPIRVLSAPSTPSTVAQTISPSLLQAHPYTPCVDNVPRTNAANKRLRKDKDDSNDLPPAKKQRQYISNGCEDECIRDSVISVISSNDIIPVETPVETSQPQQKQQTPSQARRAGRKKKREDQGSDLRQKMAAVIGSSNTTKVKTTSELLYELAEKKGDARLARRASKLEEREKDKDPSPQNDSVDRNKQEHMEKFLKSTPQYDDDDDDEITIIEVEDDSEPSSPAPTPTLFAPVETSNPHSPTSNIDLLGITVTDTEEEILARLPALRMDSITDSPSPPPLREESEVGGKEETEHVERLHATCIDSQNGNFDMDGRFREWHELTLQKAYQDAPLVVLPYVVTDF